MLNTISAVSPESASYEAGLVPGDTLLEINGKKVQDVLDYMYYSYDSDPEFLIEHADGTRESIRLSKEEGEDAGLDFESYLMDSPRACANNCIFCFVDQLPAGMRDTLYFKDDDVRLSFLTGSYITLTNMSERAIQRVIDLKISPINISVHTMDPDLRCIMLGNRNAGRGVETIRRFAGANIEMNCQIVCCPEINDGRELDRTMEALTALYPAVNSVSVIPVGLTRHREGLYPIEPYTMERALATVRQVEKMSEMCLHQHGSRIFFCSDEFYLKAGLPIPEEEFYEDYPQLENGVGLIRLLISEFEEAMELEQGPAAGTPFTIATGVSAAGTLEALLNRAKERFPGIKGQVRPIVNNFFGHTVDVAGLITGQDLIAQLRGLDLGERVYITNRMLRDGGGVFLDDVTLEDAQRELGVPVIPLENDGGVLLDAMME